MTEGSTPLFQQEKSTFVEVTRNQIIDLARTIGDLEDVILMEPKQYVENEVSRLPYRNFRRVFKELFMITKHRVRNAVLIAAIISWLNTTSYDTKTKVEDFQIGLSFAEQYIDEMYKIGLLDMNIPEPVDFPFQDILEEIAKKVIVNETTE